MKFMIVYSATKAEFNNDISINTISDKILSKLLEANTNDNQDAEYRAWQNSLNFMKCVLAEGSSQMPMLSKEVN